jgi:hypothetical protein
MKLELVIEFFYETIFGCYMDVWWSTIKIQDFLILLWYYYQFKTFKTTNITI